MIVQLQEATQYYYYRAVLAIFPLAPDQIRAQIWPNAVRGGGLFASEGTNPFAIGALHVQIVRWIHVPVDSFLVPANATAHHDALRCRAKYKQLDVLGWVRDLHRSTHIRHLEQTVKQQTETERISSNNHSRKVQFSRNYCYRHHHCQHWSTLVMQRYWFLEFDTILPKYRDIDTISLFYK